MAKFTAQITKVITNGPYAYIIYKDGVGQKSSDNVATVTDALNGVRDDISGLLGGQVIQKISLSAESQ